ncbi:MAG: acetylglutamate kinase [Clostridium sp.]|nr:acetylglutamate kinase [Clostridium sp.]
MINVVKIGGNVVDDPKALNDFLKEFSRIAGRKMLVHGGGKEATRLAAALGIETKMIDGRRVTDAATLDVVTMVYAGLINKRIVSKLQALGCNAIGLSGADAGVIAADRRKPVVKDGVEVDYGFVGDICDGGVDDSQLANFLDMGLTPVICAIMHDGEGNLLNCNADTVAAATAIGLSNQGLVTLTYCFEQPGVLSDVSDPSSVIDLITPETFAECKAGGIVSGGMLPKIENALAAVSAGVDSVVIKQASALTKAEGTIIRL